MRKLVIEKAAVKHNLSVIKEKAAGAAIGAVGSGFAIRRFLQV